MTWWEAGSGVVIAALTAWNSWTTRRANRTAVQATSTVRAVEHELTQNSGNSLRDVVDRIEYRVGQLHGLVTQHGERLTVLEQRGPMTGLGRRHG